MSRKLNTRPSQNNGINKQDQDSDAFLSVSKQLENVQNEINRLKEENEIHQTDSQAKKFEVLENELCKLKEEYTIHQTNNQIKKLETLEKENIDLLKQVTAVETRQTTISYIFAAISLIFVAVSLGGYLKIYQLDNFTDSRAGTNKLLINLMEQKSANLLNKLNITGSSDEEVKEIKELEEFVGILEKLEVQDEKFNELKFLIEPLSLIVLRNNLPEALNKTKQAISHNPKPFVKSRLLTLSVVILVAQARNEQISKFHVLDNAIELDKTNALAFNTLAILQANKARDSIVKKGVKKDEKSEIHVEPTKYNETSNIFREAALNFEMSASLNQSAVGYWKYSNNRTWVNLIRLRYIINTEKIEGSSKIEEFLKDNKYQSIEQFFKEIITPLEQYEINTKFPNPSETLAQIYWLEAEYKRKTNKFSPEEITELEDKGQKKFEIALNRQLYNRTTSKNESEIQFKEDYLHKYIEEYRPNIFNALVKIIKAG